MTVNPRSPILTDADRLEEIHREMSDLLREARQIARRHLTMAECDRAERTWVAHIEMALDRETRWLGRCDNPLESDLARLRAKADGIEDLTHSEEVSDGK